MDESQYGEIVPSDYRNNQVYTEVKNAMQVWEKSNKFAVFGIFTLLWSWISIVWGFIFLFVFGLLSWLFFIDPNNEWAYQREILGHRILVWVTISLFILWIGLFLYGIYYVISNPIQITKVWIKKIFIHIIKISIACFMIISPILMILNF